MPFHRIPARLLPQLSGSPDKIVGWANQGPNGYDLHGVGPLSYVVAITHTPPLLPFVYKAVTQPL